MRKVAGHEMNAASRLKQRLVPTSKRSGANGTATAASAAGSTRSARYWEVDALRGIAILMMATYHFAYDLDYFADFDINARAGFWAWFADLTAFSFIFLAGVALVISHARAASRSDRSTPIFEKYLRRGTRIFLYGMILTVVTFFVDSDRFIQFGILHVIGFSIVAAYPFLHRPPATTALWGLAIIAVGLWFDANRLDVPYPWFYWLGLRPEGISSFDYRPVLPWFGAALLGISAGRLLYPNGLRRFPLPDLNGIAPIDALSFMGRWSLLIYFVHQPILIAALILLGFASVDSLI